MADNDAACVYHSMGAAEYGARGLATNLQLAGHLQATFGSMIKHLRPMIERLQQDVKTPERNEELDFYNQLVDQCGFFNEHWRKRLAHLPMPRYNAAEALDALTRSAEFFDDSSGARNCITSRITSGLGDSPTITKRTIVAAGRAVGVRSRGRCGCVLSAQALGDSSSKGTGVLRRASRNA
jgi:hypothetical protein